MVQVSDIQAQSISAEAVSHLRSNDPVQIPEGRLTQEFADALNEQIEAQTGRFWSSCGLAFACAWSTRQPAAPGSW